jgi:hypothetical protein
MSIPPVSYLIKYISYIEEKVLFILKMVCKLSLEKLITKKTGQIFVNDF